MPYSIADTSPSVTQLLSLQGRDALVIGGAGLLGYEIGAALAEFGARVIIASRDQAKCDQAIEAIRSQFPQANPVAMPVDITSSAKVQALMKMVGNLTNGSLDILVNCGWSGRKNTFDSISEEDWDQDIEVCLTGVFRTIKAAFPLLKARRGTILNIASMYAHVAPDYRLYDSERLANPPSYGAAKAGVLQLTRYLASFLSPHGIRVNCISPGPFPFETTQKAFPDFIDRLATKNPLGRIGLPHEIKGPAILLCSDAGSYMTGQNICVDGGWSVW